MIALGAKSTLIEAPKNHGLAFWSEYRIGPFLTDLHHSLRLHSSQWPVLRNRRRLRTHSLLLRNRIRNSREAGAEVGELRGLGIKHNHMDRVISPCWWSFLRQKNTDQSWAYSHAWSPKELSYALT